MTLCAALDCTTPNAAVHIAVADFAYCSTCWREITKRGDMASLCAALLASEAETRGGTKDAPARPGAGRNGASR